MTTTVGRVPLTENRSSSNVINHHQWEEVNAQITELKLTVDGLEKERDFYFGKLRDIEILCQKHETDESSIVNLRKNIQNILYSTEEGFEIPTEEENGLSNFKAMTIDDETF